MNNLKILICDDNEKKTDKILDFFYKTFHYGIDIDIAYNIETSKEQIEENKYNLLFVDLNMPEGEHDSAHNNAGNILVDFINSLYENHTYEIVLLTSINDARDNQQDLIKNYSFIDYTHTNKNGIEADKLLEVIKEKAKILDISLKNKVYDIAIITALSEEMTEVRNAFEIIEKKYNWVDVPIYNDIHTYKAIKIENSNQETSTIISVSANKMGMAHSASLASKVIIKFKPKLIVMLGICAGNKKEGIELGDIIIVEKSFDYQAGKIETNSDGVEIFYPDYDMLQLDPTYCNIFNDKKIEWTYGIAESWRKATGTKFSDPEAYLGVFGSGASVMATDTVFTNISEHSRKILAIDMEAYSIFVAATSTFSKNEPKALVIKCVQDFAGKDKKSNSKIPERDKDKYRKFGSFASAIFLINACKDSLIAKLNEI